MELLIVLGAIVTAATATVGALRADARVAERRERHPVTPG